MTPPLRDAWRLYRTFSLQYLFLAEKCEEELICKKQALKMPIDEKCESQKFWQGISVGVNFVPCHLVVNVWHYVFCHWTFSSVSYFPVLKQTGIRNGRSVRTKLSDFNEGELLCSIIYIESWEKSMSMLLVAPLFLGKNTYFAVI